MSNIALFNEIPTTKVGQYKVKEELKTLFLDGETPILEQAIKAKALAEILDSFVKDGEVKEAITMEVQKYGSETTVNGTKLQIKEAGVRYDYSECGDVVLNRLYEQKKQLDEAIKAREKFVYSCAAGTPLIDEESGEVYTINPPIKTSSTITQITFKKSE